jgi:hypothetical protein
MRGRNRFSICCNVGSNPTVLSRRPLSCEVRSAGCDREGRFRAQRLKF